MRRNFSSKSFGIFTASALLILASFLLLKTDHHFQYGFGALVGSSLVLLVAFFAPHLLSGPADVWHSIGQMAAKVTNPLILGVLFFGTVTPLSIICKLCGRDVLKTKAEKCSSYWTDKECKVFCPKSFTRQF